MMRFPRPARCMVFAVLACLCHGAMSAADTMSVTQAVERARAAYPLSRQTDLINKAASYSVAQAYKGYYPQVSVTAQATYQSDVTAVPFSLPSMSITPLSNDQYRLQAEVSQTMYDGGMMSNMESIARAASALQGRQLDVELYKLRDRVQQLVAGIVMLHEQIDQVRTRMSDVQATRAAIRGAVDAGAALRSDIDMLDAELLTARQREATLMSERLAYVGMLSMLTGTTIDTSTSFMLAPSFEQRHTLQRPELAAFDAQSNLVQARERAIDARSLPRFSAFVQGGYGRPGLNMLRNEFDPYYVMGVRMMWTLTDLYASADERELLQVEQQQIDVQRATFDMNAQLTLTQLERQIQAFDKVLALDDDIIAKRTAVRNVTKAQFEAGTVRAHDYLRDANSLDMAIRDRTMHRLQRSLAILTHDYISGN
ncbi:MAG: TolC family protein [Candidatus Kapabacteria bacterium]|nr:TolC family protein [Candidatus Kapabacteria bacterium]